MMNRRIRNCTQSASTCACLHADRVSEECGGAPGSARYVEFIMSITDQVKKLAVPLLDSLGLELFDLTYQKTGKRGMLRIFIEKEQGITLDDCQRVSREIGALLDIKDVVPGSYILEVSSPGLNRPMRNEQDYLKYRGSRIKVHLLTKISDRKIYVGINRGIEQETLILEISENREIRIPLSNISRANLEVDFPF